MITLNIEIEMNICVELVAENKYGKLFKTSEGWHINGDKPRFINRVKNDLNSNDPMAVAGASYVLFILKNFEEI